MLAGNERLYFWSFDQPLIACFYKKALNDNSKELLVIFLTQCKGKIIFFTRLGSVRKFGNNLCRDLENISCKMAIANNLTAYLLGI